STGFSGTAFEVTPAKEVVWRYIVPADPGLTPGPFGPPGGGRQAPAGMPMFVPTRSVQLFPGFLALLVQLDPKQRKQLEEFEKEPSRTLDQALTDEQRKLLKEAQKAAASGDPAALPEIGQVMPRAVQDKLKLTAEQRKQVADLQKQADDQLG